MLRGNCSTAIQRVHSIIHDCTQFMECGHTEDKEETQWLQVLFEKWDVTFLGSQDDSWEQKQRDSEQDIYRTLDAECKKWEVRDV